MKIHTNDFKSEISKMGRKIDNKIIIDEKEIPTEQINSITHFYEGNILQSVMKELDIDSNVDIPLGTILRYQFGVLVNNEYEYLNFGNYVVYSSEKQEDTRSYKIICYDKMLYSMKTNENLEITYPISVRDYINALCTKLGLEFKNKDDIFANYNREITSELYVGLDYTYRDIFDELAQVTASTICLDGDDKVEIRYISNESVDTFDEEFLKDVNVNFGDKYGKVNSIVLSRSAESDNIYLQDEESIAQNGLCELKIIDNQIMNFNDRADYLPDILKKLNGLEYYINDFASTGITYLELCDRYSVQVGDNTYSCVMFNDEILVTQGLVENVYTELPEESETDYTKSDKTDKKINRVSLIVNKQEQTIESTVAQINDIEENYTQLKQTSDDLTITVGNNTTSLEDLQEQTSNNTTVIGTMQGTIVEMTTKFTTKGLQIGKTGENINSTLDNNGLKVYNVSKLIAIFNKNGSGMNKLIVTGSIQFQNLLIKKGVKETQKHGNLDVIQGFWLENLIESLEDLEG